VCADILKEKWQPSFTLKSVMEAVLGLLSHPNCDSPENVDAGKIKSIFFQTRRKRYLQKSH
jgi:ubiquitin-protein ligase